MEHRVLYEHQRNALTLDPHAIVRILHHRSTHGFVESSNGLMKSSLHSKTAAARHGQIRGIPQFLEAVLLRMLHPSPIELRHVDPTRDEIMDCERSGHCCQPVLSNFIVRVAKRQGGGASVPSPDVSRMRGAWSVRSVDNS